jgi:hypothetical protein
MNMIARETILSKKRALMKARMSPAKYHPREASKKMGIDQNIGSVTGILRPPAATAQFRVRTERASPVSASTVQGRRVRI